MRTIKIYDTTLRDGTQAEGVSLSLIDKIAITKKLDEIGIHYIEGGWPGSNPKDIAYFKEVQKLKLKNSLIAAFGSTHRASVKVEEEQNMRALIEANTPVITIFGKTWDLHVRVVLRISDDKNLEIIHNSVKFLKKKKKEVIYDAEHFFDGYKTNPEYALKTIGAALEGGADWLVLCDTNGGTLVGELQKIVREVRKTFDCKLGIHTHNDSGVGVANAIAAIDEGCNQVQGTINGIGERCGNANLCSIVPNIKLKLKLNCLTSPQLKKLYELSHYVNELANLIPDERQPYIGASAFAHKGGMHVNAVEKDAATFEHIPPELVGNKRRILLSELAGKSNVILIARQLGIELKDNDKVYKDVLKRIKELENEGYEFEGAEASFKLLVKKAMGKYKPLFRSAGFRVVVEKKEDGCLISEATVKIIIKDKEILMTAEGDGPVNALDTALRKALRGHYPEISKVHLKDYKVRVLDAKEGTAAKVRVHIESGDQHDNWNTVGVSENIIEASWWALVDSIEYKLLKD
ncbi:citramalate synthase [PVC group bacterium]|nr:citramalate synthase [PVC group bacterium]